MTSNFDACNDSKQPLPQDSQAMTNGSGQQPLVALDNLKRDRFELLSAYLDGEITAAERRQVEDWLEHDPVVQRLYARLLKLRQGMRNLPVPCSEQPLEQTVERVISRIERRPKRLLAWGGVAVAAMLVSAVLGNLPGLDQPIHQMAIDAGSGEVASDALMIALDRPVVEIPKAPVSSPSRLSTEIMFQPGSEIR
ncbi:zf-HC2 domain-containing protein [Oculatella sp. LEGE 06141]|uniref:anti-sigma factor family protein n=1 Tax=Oculatella sp. LEGE 06141 TaxID=1828648 RepID=UPI001882B71D|nr:zf-HC2 domain-containing protein [Oculatella sp. LEGE 06141]MBE9181376.1 zf-HC2 domain-containing protein [Oculatella sp. LEGE 06141]